MVDLSAVRKEIERFDDLREKLIRLSRDVLKLSKAAIFALHRDDVKRADSLLSRAKDGIRKLKAIAGKDVHLFSVGAYGEGLEEYAEACCFASFLKTGRLPSAKGLGLDAHVFVSGLCDCVGELVRRAVNAAIKDDVTAVNKIHDIVSDVYGGLLLFDWRNSPARRKFDAVKYGVEKLEDLVLRLKLKRGT